MTIFLCAILISVAAAFKASASALKFVEYFPVGNERLDSSPLYLMYTPPPSLAAAVAGPSV